MKKEGYRRLVIKAVDEAKNGDQEQLNLLATHLEDVDKAKQILREKGYGWTGLSLLETVIGEIPAQSGIVIWNEVD